MKTKTCIILMAILLGSLFLLPTFAFITPLVSDNGSRLEQGYVKPKSSAGVDLTIIVTDQQLPGVKNVTADFLASPLGSGVSSVTVISSGTTSDTQFTTISTSLASGSTQYDIVGIDTTWMAQFAENGWIIPLDSYISNGQLDLMSNFVGGMAQASTYNGHIYAYPYFMNLGILWYRTDLLDLQYGAGNWSPSMFRTWEGLNQTANDILNNASLTATRPDLVGYVGQFDNYEGGVVNFFEISGSAGATNLISGNIVDISGNTKLEYAMKFFQGLVPPQYTGVQGTPYIIPRDGLVMDEGSSITTWIENNSIFMRQWTFAYPMSIDNGIDFGIAPLPHFAGATNYKTSCVGGALLAIPTAITGAQRAAAINFTKYLGETHAQQRELVNTSNFPALKSIYANPPAGFDWIKNWTSQFDQTLSRPVEAKYPQISSVISNEFSNILSGGTTVNTALNRMQEDIEALLGPGDFTLTSDADNPDTDGTFNLSWTSSAGADNYSLYAYHNYITEVNQSLTLLADQDANSPFTVSESKNGIYYYIVKAENNQGTTLSNCISVNVSHFLPGPFTLISSAENPDPDGKFDLAWTSSAGADNYSLYSYHDYITEINQSLTLLADQNATSPLSVSGLTSGTYYYVIVANNVNGNTLSNNIKVIVDIPKKTPVISGYDEFLLLAIIGLTAMLVIFRRFKITTNKKDRL
jgi:multiple sugar transport system substrate-binding protein